MGLARNSSGSPNRSRIIASDHPRLRIADADNISGFPLIPAKLLAWAYSAMRLAAALASVPAAGIMARRGLNGLCNFKGSYMLVLEHGIWPGLVRQWRLIDDRDQPDAPCASCGEPPDLIVFFEQPAAEAAQQSERWCFRCISVQWADKLTQDNYASENGDPPVGTAGNMAHFWRILTAARQSHREILQIAEREGWEPNGVRKPMAKLDQAAKFYLGGNSGPNLKWMTMARQVKGEIGRYLENISEPSDCDSP